MAALMTLLRPFLARDGAAFSSVFQAGLRWNGYIALGVIAGLFGPEGLSLAAVGFAVLVPINNVLSVLVLSRYAGATPAPALQVIRSIAGNPLILSTLLAIALVQTGLQLSDPVANTLNLLGDATIALGLICVGAALDFGAMRQAKWPLAAGVILRLLVMPVVTFAIGGLLGLAAPALTIAIICVSAPVATSAYILARQLGGDSRLMANIISLTTLVSLVTLPLALLLVQGLAR
jgi:predicted permease